MPFQWKRKTNRRPASPDRMEKAVKEVVGGEKLRTTAKKYDLDKMTLRRYVMKFKEKGNNIKFSPNLKCSQIFDEDEEKSLAKYLLDAARMNYGLTTTETRKFAYMYAVENGKIVSESWKTNKMATRDWLRGFMLRNKDLSLRTPEPTSLSRATAFNKHTVGEFYKLLGEVLRREQLGPNEIYNYDETGVQTVHKPSKIKSKKGQKQVSKATSGERGQTVTVCCAINAAGNSVPPVFIFPRIREQDYMTRGAPPGSKAVTHPSGWMTSDNFEKYLLHFIKFVKCNKDNKVLLILDNHVSHIAPTVLKLCKDNGIVMLTIPPHTSHRLQPLDVSVYGPFKTYFNQACDDFMVNHPGQTITLQDIAGLVGNAYKRSITPINIMKGFLKTGICPFDSHIFTSNEFLSSSVTDRPPPDREHTPEPTATTITADLGEHTPTPGQSCLDECTPQSFSKDFQSQKTPEEVRPLPKAPPRKNQSHGRKPVKTKILTDTPNTTEIKEDFMQREIKRRKNTPKATQVKRKVFEYDSASSSDSVPAEVSATSSEEVTDIEDQIENEKNEESFCQGVITVDDYVLVPFRSKKSVKHYVGRVLQIDKTTDDRQVRFMRRNGLSFHFIYPDVIDDSFVQLTDIIKLPPPNFVGGTARAERKLAFPVNFLKYENVN